MDDRSRKYFNDLDRKEKQQERLQKLIEQEEISKYRLKKQLASKPTTSTKITKQKIIKQPKQPRQLKAARFNLTSGTYLSDIEGIPNNGYSRYMKHVYSYESKNNTSKNPGNSQNESFEIESASKPFYFNYSSDDD